MKFRPWQLCHGCSVEYRHTTKELPCEAVALGWRGSSPGQREVGQKRRQTIDRRLIWSVVPQEGGAFLLE